MRKYEGCQDELNNLTTHVSPLSQINFIGGLNCLNKWDEVIFREIMFSNHQFPYSEGNCRETMLFQTSSFQLNIFISCFLGPLTDKDSWQ